MIDVTRGMENTYMKGTYMNKYINTLCKLEFFGFMKMNLSSNSFCIQISLSILLVCFGAYLIIKAIAPNGLIH